MANQNRENGLKILFVNDELTGGGVEKLLNDLLPLMNKKHCCDLLVLTFKGEKYKNSLLDAGVKVSAIPEHIQSHWQKIKYIKQIIEKEQYDIVHASEFPAFYYCSIIKRMMRAKSTFPKFVMTEHDTDNRRRHHKSLRLLEKWIYAGYDRVISISSETQSELLKWIKVRNEGKKYKIIFNGIPLKKFQEVESYKKEDIIQGSKESDIVLCMVGRFDPKKNHLFMVDVLRCLPSNYRLIFVGEGELFREVKEKVAQQGLEKKVHFLGFRSDVGAIIKASDIVVIPSKWEGFGLIAVEAMACGRVVVCSDVPGLSEVVGEGGVKVPVEDCQAFVSAIISLEKKELRELFIKKGREQIKKFSIEMMQDGYMALYSELIERSNLY